MDAFISYLVKSIIASGILYGYYCIAQRNKKFHAYNRFYLLGVMALSMLIPFINISWVTLEQPRNIPLQSFTAIISKTGMGEVPYHAEPGWWVPAFSGLVSLVLVVILVSRIAWSYRIKATSHKIA